MQIGVLYREIEALLRVNCESREVSSIEAYCLVSHVIKKDKSFLLTYPEYEVSVSDAEAVRALVRRRLDGEPIAYILGSRDFWTLTLKVTKDTLIPRADTETLVEQALVEAQKWLHAGLSPEKLRILDLGTGSGAVALALKKELPQAMVDAIDYSEGACAVAQENANNLNLPIKVWRSDWFSAIKEQHQYHIIVSNPPYIAEGDEHLSKGDLRYEPRTALVAPMRGLKDLVKIVRLAPKYLVNEGSLLVEHGFNQGGEVKSLFHDADFTSVETVRDLGQNERVTKGQYFYKA